MGLSPVEMHQVRNAIFLNTFPSKDIEIVDTVFHITFSPAPVPGDTLDAIEYFTPLVNISYVLGKDFLRELPVPLFMALFIDYFSFHQNLFTKLSENIYEFIETAESSNAWKIFKQVGPEYAIKLDKKKLNAFQYLWVLHNVQKDEQDKHTLINSVIDVLKPWLNHELYAKVNEKEDATRANWMFDNPDFEEGLLRKADTILKERHSKTVSDEDLDIIEIEENNG